MASMDVEVKWGGIDAGQQALKALAGTSASVAKTLEGLKGTVLSLPNAATFKGIASEAKQLPGYFRDASIQAGNLNARMERGLQLAKEVGAALKAQGATGNSSVAVGSGNSNSSGVGAAAKLTGGTQGKLIDAEAQLNLLQSKNSTEMELREARVNVAKLTALFKREEELLNPTTKPTKALTAYDLVKGAHTKGSRLDALQGRLGEIADPEERERARMEIERQRYLADRSVHLDTTRQKDREANLRAPGMLESFRGIESAIKAALAGNLIGAAAKVIDLTGFGKRFTEPEAPGGLNLAQKTANLAGMVGNPATIATNTGPLAANYWAGGAGQRFSGLINAVSAVHTPSNFGEPPDKLSASLRRIPGIGKALAGIAGRRTASGGLLGSIADSGFDLGSIAKGAGGAAGEGLATAAGEAAAGSSALSGLTAAAGPAALVLGGVTIGLKLLDVGLKSVAQTVGEAVRTVSTVSRAAMQAGGSASGITALGAYGVDAGAAAGVARGVRNAVSAGANPLSIQAGQRVGVGVQSPEGIGLVNETALTERALAGLRANYQRDTLQLGEHTAALRAERDARLLGLDSYLFELKASELAFGRTQESARRLGRALDDSDYQRNVADLVLGARGLQDEFELLKVNAVAPLIPQIGAAGRGLQSLVAGLADNGSALGVGLGNGLRSGVDALTGGLPGMILDVLKAFGMAGPQSAAGAQAQAQRDMVDAMRDNTAALRDGLHGGGGRAAAAVNVHQLTYDASEAQRARWRRSSY